MFASFRDDGKFETIKHVFAHGLVSFRSGVITDKDGKLPPILLHGGGEREHGDE